VPFTLMTTLVTVFGMSAISQDPSGSTVVGLLALVALAAVAASATALSSRPSADTGIVRVRVVSLRRRAAAVGVVLACAPDAPGRTRARAPDGLAVPA